MVRLLVVLRVALGAGDVMREGDLGGTAARGRNRGPTRGIACPEVTLGEGGLCLSGEIKPKGGGSGLVGPL